MLAVLFSLGDQRCGLDSAVVERIVPALPLTAVEGGPTALAGTFSYRGASVPVIDLVRQALGRPAHPHLSSRIILARHAGEGASPRLVGLLAERVNEIQAFSEQASSSVPETFRVVTLAEVVPADFFAQPFREAAAS
jgi:chemotaxis-related protein WspB